MLQSYLLHSHALLAELPKVRCLDLGTIIHQLVQNASTPMIRRRTTAEDVKVIRLCVGNEANDLVRPVATSLSSLTDPKHFIWNFGTLTTLRQS